MPFLRLLLAAAALIGLGSVWPAHAQDGVRLQAVGHSASAAHGSIQGVVTDERGEPVGGAMVSAFGNRMSFALTGRDGRFVFRALPPGPYVVRAHREGFAASSREMVEVSASTRPAPTLRLRRIDDASDGPAPRPAVLAASFDGVPGLDQPADEAVDPAAPRLEPGQHDHGELAWRLRHLKRPVLRESTGGIAILPEDEDFVPESERVAGRWAALPAPAFGPLGDLPVTGQLNLLTAGTFDDPQQLFHGEGLPRGLAFVSIGAPAGSQSEWSVQGAMTQGDLSTWILSGSYATRVPGAHDLDVGLAYSTQRYDGGNAAALAAVSDGRRNVGLIHAFDTWTVTRRIALDYGVRYARHDYVTSPNQFSPRLGIAVSPIAGMRIRALASQRRLVPGAEEFWAPPVAGVWLLPERTFAPLVGGSGFHTERSRHVEVGIEQDWSTSWIIGVRHFQQSVDDQLVTLFGFSAEEGPRSDLGHYFVANGGSVQVEGWGVNLKHALSRRLRGSLDYSVSSADWTPSAESQSIRRWAPSAVRAGRENVHDVTTSIEAEIPETHTRVFVLYKINTAYSRGDVLLVEPGSNARFDVQITQSLPFMRLPNTHWEALIAVRNLFREPADDSSVFDELMVVRPPKRIVGGLLLRF